MTAPRATFTRMQDSTQADWAVILPEAVQMAMGLPDRVLSCMRVKVARAAVMLGLQG